MGEKIMFLFAMTWSIFVLLAAFASIIFGG